MMQLTYSANRSRIGNDNYVTKKAVASRQSYSNIHSKSSFFRSMSFKFLANASESLKCFFDAIGKVKYFLAC